MTYDNTLLDEDEFGDRVEERLEAIADLDEMTRSGLEIGFRYHSRPNVLELEHFFLAYRRSPAQLDSLLETIEQAVRSLAPDRSQQLWDELEDRIYPMLKPLETVAEVAERGLPPLIYQPFFEGLIMCYVIDERDSVAFINTEHLRAWGVLESTVHQQALDNLRRRTLQPDMLQVTGQGAQMLFIYATQDGYDAARILLTDLPGEWQQQIPGQLVLGIPMRDLLIGFSDADPAILQRIATQISQDASRLDYRLTDQLFTLVNGRLEPYSYDWTSSEQILRGPLNDE